MHACQTDRYYEVLGLDVTASPEHLKRAHRDLVQVWHPDRFTANPRLQQRAQEKLLEINQAYDALRSIAPAATLDALTPRAAPLKPSASPSRTVVSTPLAPRTLRDWLYLGAPGFGVAVAIFVLILSARVFCNYFTAEPAPVPVPLAAAPSEVHDPDPFKAPAPAVRHRSATAAQTSVVEPAISNGDDIVTPRGRVGVGQININNQTDQDAVASLLESDSGAVRRMVYVSANMQITIDGIGPGVYRIALDSGSEWTRSSGFKRNRTASRSAGPFAFTQVQTASQVQGDHYSIVLRNNTTGPSGKLHAGI